eukprot:5077649-Amphidinium_carterae.1
MKKTLGGENRDEVYATCSLTTAVKAYAALSLLTTAPQARFPTLKVDPHYLSCRSEPSSK